MKIIIIGAGATYAEAEHLGIEQQLRPPLMKNFAKRSRIWENFNPHPYLDRFLEGLGYKIENEDGRQQFYELENEGIVNIEQFFEFCWKHREKSWGWSDNSEVKKPGRVMNMRRVLDGKQINPNLPADFIKGTRSFASGPTTLAICQEKVNFWDNMLHQGFGFPFAQIIINCFHVNGKGTKELLLSKKVASLLGPGDLVVNLNYDTVFEQAVNQLDSQFTYCPDMDAAKIMICKPHGSLNMFINSSATSSATAFIFGKPEYLGSGATQGWYNYLALVPPRSNKTYEQNPISKILIDQIKCFSPEEISFWGVGFTESDVDLIELFKRWSVSQPTINVVNPDYRVCQKMEKILDCKTIHYNSVDSWIP